MKIPEKDELLLVSKCPHCGAPIYAKGKSTEKEPPETVYTCGCATLVSAALARMGYQWPISTTTPWTDGIQLQDYCPPPLGDGCQDTAGG